MGKMTPEEQYREAFFNRVQKECRKQDINCSMVYDRIHIYTKYEDFYFTPDPNEITLMHRNAQKESDGGYKYHVQGVWSNRTPESLVREVVSHTKYRYTEDGEYLAEKDIQAEKAIMQKEQTEVIEAPTERKHKTNTKRWKVNRQTQIQEFRGELKELCEDRGLNCRDVNQLTYVDNGFEEFIVEFTTNETKIQNKKCAPLRIKETYNAVYGPDQLTPIEVVEFAEAHISIHNHEEYAAAFCDRVKERCDHYHAKCKRDGDRIYIYGPNGTYYVDAICGSQMEIYRKGQGEPLIQCQKNANAQYVVDYVFDRNKAANEKDEHQDWSRIALIFAAASGWIVAGILFAYILCPR